jgi:hypothetical protein
MIGLNLATAWFFNNLTDRLKESGFVAPTDSYARTSESQVCALHQRSMK